ncbi:dipeptidase PepE [Rubrivirga sp. S365]|uniref:Dipeptidase PepE n=1 Tax=Rubrivirga litoralis TaxID=3075598 RepID=A0ABU3BT64_9BACT|nr:MULTISPECIES: dipeptidase PepE [unclassified Rubrivirga]MDT0632488.1 dipeptidase PepE [Rubrivirga sp. F394]MDT7857988.1 dipeptidase PepE [Rubrivirga sp. S365]
MLLLLSNSTSPGQPYLAHARDWIADAVGGPQTGGAGRIAFVPYAAVTFSYDDYTRRVADALDGLGLEIEGVHTSDRPAQAVADADAVFVGGGNTFHLLRSCYEHGLVDAIRARVGAGAPYVGWSAGANLACPTIRTTNDMPVVEPPSFEALGLVPVQINPHYTDAHPTGHQGETRAQRLAEFVAANPDAPVVGLPEGTALRVDGARVEVLGGPQTGGADARVFDAASPEGRRAEPGEVAALVAGTAPPA